MFGRNFRSVINQMHFIASTILRLSIQESINVIVFFIQNQRLFVNTLIFILGLFYSNQTENCKKTYIALQFLKNG